jgi:hypothetical protein
LPINQNKYFSFLIFAALLFLFIPEMRSQSIGVKQEDINRELSLFHYDKVISLGRKYLENAQNSGDSLEVMQVMLYAAYSLNDEAVSKKISLEILAINPDYRLNPKLFSPKMIARFRAEQKQYQETITKHSPTDSEPFPRLEGYELAISVIIPGSGHLTYGEKNKGLLFLGGTAIIGGSLAYFCNSTAEAKDNYKQALPGDDFDALYNTYNTNLKIRNSLAVLYGLYGLYSMIDLYQTFQNDLRLRLKPPENRDGLVMSVSWKW